MLSLNSIFLKIRMKTLIVNVCIAAFLFVSCKSKLEKTKPIIEKITESVYASGIIKSKNQHKVFSIVNGIVDKILIAEGKQVMKGDTIIALVNTNSELNTENASIAANYAASSNNQEKLAELQTTINSAKLKMDNDISFEKKQQNLWNQDVGTKNELELKQLAAKSSRNNYLASKLKYAEVKKQINFQAMQSSKNLQISKSQKNDFTIKSDMDGRLYHVLIEKGEMVNTQMPIAIIGDSAIFILELQIDEYDINRIKKGQKIYVSMDSYKNQVFEAVVSILNPIMNEKTKSFTIEAHFLIQPSQLYPNLTCEANIVIETKDKVITIPRNYLLEGDSVWIDAKKKKKVMIGLKDYQKVEIVSGITVKDFIYKPE
jgi:HlyD family secretion protein